jgi:hypothetical protein
MKDDRKKKSAKAKEKIPAKKKEDAVEEKPFDFGGLPARDLKKNLGC